MLAGAGVLATLACAGGPAPEAEMRVLFEIGHPVDALAVQSDTVLTASRDRHVRRWPLAGGPGEIVLTVEPRPPSTLAVQGDTVWVAAGWRLWRVGPGGPVEVPVAFEDAVGGVAPGPNGTLIIGDDNRVHWIADDGDVRWRGETYKWGYGVALQAGGTQAVVHTWDGYLYAVDTAALPAQEPSQYRDHPYAELPYPDHPMDLMPVFDAVWHGDSVWVVGHALSGEGGGAYRWRPGHDAWMGPGWRDPTGGLNAIARSPAGDALAVGGQSGRVTLLDPETAEVRQDWDLNPLFAGPLAEPVSIPIPVDFTDAVGPATVLDLAFTPDGQAVLAATAGGAVVRLPVR